MRKTLIAILLCTFVLSVLPFCGIAELENSAQGLYVTPPKHWQQHLDERVDHINAAMSAASGNRSAFLFYSDAHWSYNAQQSPVLLKYLATNTAIKKVIFGGDIVQDEEGDMSYLADWRTAVSELPNHHSVPGNHDDGNKADDIWSADRVYDYLLAAEKTDDVVMGNGLYYYIDDAAERTRYLYLDSATYGGTIAWDKEQQAWLKDALLTTPAGYHIIAVAHIWVEVDYTVTPPVAGSLDPSAEVMLGMFDAYNARTGDFAGCSGRVEFCIGGHAHVDADYVSADGIPVILVECDSLNVRSGFNHQEGTIGENSINAVVANYRDGVITIVRVGRGRSRIVHLDGSGAEYLLDDERNPDGSIPEIPTGDFSNVLTAVGWSDSTRYSTSARAEIFADGWDITGYISAGMDDTIYMANVTFVDVYGRTTGSPQAKILLFDADKNYLTSSPAYSPDLQMDATWAPRHAANGDVIQFTCPHKYSAEDVAYIRIVAQNITKYSVITVNEPID